MKRRGMRGRREVRNSFFCLHAFRCGLGAWGLKKHNSAGLFVRLFEEVLTLQLPLKYKTMDRAGKNLLPVILIAFNSATMCELVIMLPRRTKQAHQKGSYVPLYFKFRVWILRSSLPFCSFIITFWVDEHCIIKKDGTMSFINHF